MWLWGLVAVYPKCFVLFVLLNRCRMDRPISTDDPNHRYKTWSEEVSKAPTNVLVLYASDYGFSDRLSQSLAAGITKAGVATEMMDILSADPQVGGVC